MEITFKTKNDKQLLAAEYWTDEETEELLYGGAKGGGKSFLGASLIFGDALIYPDTHFFIARLELNDLRRFTIPTIHEVFNKWGLDTAQYLNYNGQDNYFQLPNGSRVYMIACKYLPQDPLFERFGSMQMTRGWIEEAGEVPEAAKANLWLSIGRWKNKDYSLKKKLLMTANPKKGWMKREFVDPWKQNLLPPSRKFVQAFATDNTYLDPDYVNTLRNEKDKVRRQRLFEGNWEYDEDADSLLLADAVSNAFSNVIVKDNQRYMTVDVARKGKDTTVFSYWDGLELYRIDQFAKQDTFNTAQKIRDIAAIEHIPFSNIMIDEDGIGGGVVDNLLGVKGFVANSAPLPTATEIRSKLSKLNTDFTPKVNFRNLKSQCGFKLAELLNENSIAFRTPELRDVINEELWALLRHKDVDSDGKLQIKAKDDVKEELGRSPDIGDAIIFRMWYELKKTAMLSSPEKSIVINKQKALMDANQSRQAERSNK